MRTPVIVLNFKTYPEVTGKKGLELAALCDSVASETGASLVVAPQQSDVSLIASKVRIPVFAQHVDDVKQGSTTGYVTPESVKGSGASGTLLNHSEHRLKIAEIESLVSRCKGVGLETIVCTNNLGVSKAVAHFGPDFIAIEPPELIGGDTSVTTADPEIVRATVDAIKRLEPKVATLCGAGVKNGRDVAKAVELGTHGVLLASGVVKAKDPKSVLLDLVSGL